jgi:diguanylate cyclase (GGDEF)-like protein
MTVSRSSRDLWATLLPAGGALVALTIVAGLDLGNKPGVAMLGAVEPVAIRWLILAFLIVGAAGAFHRPYGVATLGLGAVVLPPALLFCGVAAAAGTAAASLLVAEVLLRSIRASGVEPVSERRRLLRAVESAGRTALATILAGLAWLVLLHVRPQSGIALSVALATPVYVLAWAGCDLGERRIRRPEQSLRWRQAIPLTSDVVGWIAGGCAASTLLLSGWGTSGLLLALIAVLALEAGRNGILLDKARSRIRNLDRLQRAGKRMTSPESEMAGVAERIYLECARVSGCLWYQFEALTPGSEFRSWWSGPAGALFEGVPEPEPHPPSLPGFHRRLPWQVIERQLRVDNKVMARFRLWCDPRRLDSERLELLERLLPQMGATVQRCLLDRESREDALTGLATRRVLERELHEAHAQAVEAGGAMALLVCDLDHFKRINDTHGHLAGDAALVAVARVLREARREGDLCCRYGGEEFVLFMPGARGEAALAAAERIRDRVASLVVEYEGTRIPLTISAGAASFPDLYIKTAAELILFADEALYEAKRRGRNRCLLDLGQGRYLDLAGSVHVAEDAPPAPEPPRIFA